MLSLMIVPLTAQELSPSKIFEKVKASIVVVKVINVKGQAMSQGSGVKLPSGRIVTNFHVVKGGARFLVGQSETFVSATIYAADAEKDLCLLEAPMLKIPGVVVSSTSTLRVGATVYAVGSPQGLELSLSNGLVSQLRGANPPIIQTTAAISPGSSGGGLFDGQGRLVGITSFYIEGGQSLNFALPVEWIDLLKLGKPKGIISRPSGEWLAQAAALEQEEKWDELSTWCLQWLKEPDANKNPDLWFLLGNAFSGSGPDVTAEALNKDLAVEAYRRALTINSEYVDAWNNLGIAYGRLQRYPEAISAYRQALKINPEHAGVWYNLGNTYRMLKRPIEAIDAYRQALKINPEHADSWFNLGNTYCTLKRTTEAIDAYRQALKINPEDADSWYMLGLTYWACRNNSAALDVAKQLRKLDAEKADQLFDLIVPK